MAALNILVCLSYLYLIPCANGANILFFFVGGTHSHDIPIWPLVTELADRNHSITFFSAHTRKPWKDSRINLLIPEEVKKINDKYLSDVMHMRLRHEEYEVWKSISIWSYDICEYVLQNPEVPEIKAILHEKKFDLVILDAVLCDCGHIIAYHHKAKVISSDSTAILPWSVVSCFPVDRYHHVFGFPTESSWIPFISTFFNYPMSLSNLIMNYIEPFYCTYKRKTEFFPKLDNLMKQFFKSDNIPSFEELERKTDLLFVNTHPSVELPRSLPPNFIQVGGMQMYSNKNATIPEDIENFVSAAEQGFILIAFGSSVDFSSIPAAIESAFFDAINRFPKIHFLVKASSQAPSHCPKNLMFKPWAPQKELMAHPKTIACITHGGLNGIIEATWTGVPLITIPIFAEQDYQSYKLQAREVGIRLELRDINADDLAAAISDITTNPMYRNNMKKLQAVFRDRPQSPVGLAAYWTEFTLRHDDLSFMNPITYQPWKVYLESWLFTPAVPCAVLLTTVAVIILTISILRNKGKKVPK